MSSAYRGWTPADIGDLEGRTVIVTGASSGIGAATARALAVAGARVIAAVRDLDKGRHTTAGMRGRVEVRHLDLSDLASVRQFADGINDDIDVLVNNAGVMGVPHTRTVDGFELQLGTNHLGPFALTGLVLPRLRDRVVTVSSQAHRQGRLRLDDLHAERGRYDASAAYAASKLANLLFAYELHRRLQAAGSPLRSLAAHPGLARSNLLHQAAPTLRLRITAFAQRHLGQPTAAGARPLLYAATADLPGGSYVGPDGFYQLRGHPTLVDSSAASKDPGAAAALWDLSEQLTGAAFDLAAARRM
jgi:NAD(P)-dependent dehydrogenase (short-subunit alcohol dehydrogenase family)